MRKYCYPILLGLLLFFAVGSRLYDVSADAPAAFAGGSQDFTTDGAYTTIHARNAVLYGNWDLFEDQYWKPLKVTIVSGLSYLVFSTAGPSRVAANVTGVILNLLSLLLFVMALAKGATHRATFLTVFFLSVSFLFWSYARVPFAENGLLFFAALIFLVYRFWFDALWGKILVGLLVACCCLFGKAFGALLLAGPVVATLLQQDARRIRDTLILLFAFCLSVLTIALMTYGNQGFLSFVLDRGVEEHGALHILESPLGYPENLISFAASGFHRFAPVLSLVVYLALVHVLIGRELAWGDKKVMTFMLAWIVAWITALSLFNYHPIRYLYVLMIPMAALAGPFLDTLSQTRFGPSKVIAVWRIVLLIILNWYLAYYVFVLPISPIDNPESYFQVVWYALPVGILSTLFILRITWRTTRVFSPTAARVMIGLVLVAVCLSDGREFQRWFMARTQNLSEADADLGQIVGSDAVIGGQYGPALTADNKIRGLLYLLRSDLTTAAQQLQGFPVTHLAVAKADWMRLVSTDSSLISVPISASYWLRDKTIVVLRVNDLLRPSGPSTYRLSDFELSGESLHRGQIDSARSYLTRFLKTYPSNKSALLRSCALMGGQREPQSWRPLIDTLAHLYPTDFWVDFVAAVYYKWLSAMTGSSDLHDKSQAYLEFAVLYNRADETSLRRRYEAVNRPSELFAATSP